MHRSFITSVNLKTSVIYSGQIRAFWDLAKAKIQDSPKTIAFTQADKYIITLRQVNDTEIIQQATIKGSNAKFHDFGGIEINNEYIINLTCVFGEKKFLCGSSRIYSQEPIFVQEEQFTANVLVQVRSRLFKIYHLKRNSSYKNNEL